MKCAIWVVFVSSKSNTRHFFHAIFASRYLFRNLTIVRNKCRPEDELHDFQKLLVEFNQLNRYSCPALWNLVVILHNFSIWQINDNAINWDKSNFLLEGISFDQILTNFWIFNHNTGQTLDC